MTTAPGQDIQEHVFVYTAWRTCPKTSLQDDMWRNKIFTGDLEPLCFAFVHFFFSLKSTRSIIPILYNIL